MAQVTGEIICNLSFRPNRWFRLVAYPAVIAMWLGLVSSERAGGFILRFGGELVVERA